MKKIQMKLETIEVQSFPTQTAGAEAMARGFAVSRVGDTWCATCEEYGCDAPITGMPKMC